jgi:hypothetical protein
MKNFSFVFAMCFISFSIGFIHSCTKDAGTPIPRNTPPDPVITTSFIEEFQDVSMLTTTANGWVKKNNSADEIDYGLTDWGQGIWGTDKSGLEYGFVAYSYSSYKDEYAFSGQSYDSISSWLISPVLSVKNGTKYRSIHVLTQKLCGRPHAGIDEQININRHRKQTVCREFYYYFA